MCLIIYKPADKEIPEHIIENAERINADGFGITYLDTMETIKTMNYEEIPELMKDNSRSFVCHYRYATVGDVNEANCHPFTFKNGRKEYTLYSNGTVADLGSDKMTDTEEVTELLSNIPQKHWDAMLSMTDVRFAIISGGLAKMYGKWHEKDGIYYSKDNCFAKRWGKNLSSHTGYAYMGKSAYEYEERQIGFYTGGGSLDSRPSEKYLQEDLDEMDQNLDAFGERFPEEWDDAIYDAVTDLPELDEYVAVYGTLREGFGNHRLLGGAEIIGTGETNDKFRMADYGIPYVYKPANHKDSAGHIHVEVYRPVDYKQWDKLDSLEGHPHHYCREKVTVTVDGIGEVEAWIYFASEGIEPNANDKFISKFHIDTKDYTVKK